MRMKTGIAVMLAIGLVVGAALAQPAKLDPELMRYKSVSGVSGWKFAALRSRSISYGVGAMAPSSV